MKQKLLKIIERYQEFIYSLVFFLSGWIIGKNLSFFNLDVFPVKIISKTIRFIDKLFTTINMEEIGIFFARSFLDFSIFIYVYLLGFIVIFTPMALCTYFGFKALKRSIREKRGVLIFFSVLLILAGLYFVFWAISDYIIPYIENR